VVADLVLNPDDESNFSVFSSADVFDAATKLKSKTTAAALTSRVFDSFFIGNPPQLLRAGALSLSLFDAIPGASITGSSINSFFSAGRRLAS
jgi:hypothetical protein